MGLAEIQRRTLADGLDCLGTREITAHLLTSSE
ncbi:hypothetical protein [Thiothrix fructosivorans]